MRLFSWFIVCLFGASGIATAQTVNVRAEFRERMEGFNSAGFTQSRDDLYYLSRFRFNATVKVNPALSFQAQLQDARVGRKEIGATGAPFKAAFDLRMGFADVGRATGRFTARVGRQEFAFGEQRLVGHVGWLNAARTFDAARVTIRGKALTVDAFAGSVVRILDGEFDKSGNGNRFAGVYGSTTKLVRQATVEPYLFYRADQGLRAELGEVGRLSQTTIGARWVGKLPRGFEYGIESAIQTGSLGTDSVSAWGGHYQIKTPAGPHSLRFVSEYNYATGDADPADGRRGAFDNLYPTPHDKYGLADQVGWRNLHHIREGVEFLPAKGWPVLVNLHSWWLAERKDGLYSAGGALVAKIAAGAIDRHVGEELDLQVSRALSPQMQLALGYAHIFTGPFLKAATPGASYSHAYVMLTYAFLAGK